MNDTTDDIPALDALLRCPKCQKPVRLKREAVPDGNGEKLVNQWCCRVHGVVDLAWTPSKRDKKT